MPKKDGMMTKAEMRDLRDAVGLALTVVGTGISIVSLALVLSPRRDTEGVGLARDLKSFLQRNGIGDYRLTDIHRAISDQEAIGYPAYAFGSVADCPDDALHTALGDASMTMRCARVVSGLTQRGDVA